MGTMHCASPANPDSNEGRMLRAILRHGELTTRQIIERTDVCNPSTSKHAINRWLSERGYGSVECEPRRVGKRRVWYYRYTGQVPLEVAV